MWVSVLLVTLASISLGLILLQGTAQFMGSGSNYADGKSWRESGSAPSRFLGETSKPVHNETSSSRKVFGEIIVDYEPAVDFIPAWAYAPNGLREGYDERCDPTSPNFQFNNVEALKADGVPMYAVMSWVGFLKALWLLFNLMLPLIFHAKFPISNAGDWVNRDGDTYAEKLKHDAIKSHHLVGEPGSLKLEASASMLKDLLTDPEIWELEASLQTKFNEKRPFYDPKDVHHTLPLQEMLPISANFDYGKAKEFVEARLSQPAKKAGIPMPWSARTQLFIFAGQTLYGVFDCFRYSFFGPPSSWQIVTGSDWHMLTFRTDMFLPALYHSGRLFVIVKSILDVDGAEGMFTFWKRVLLVFALSMVGYWMAFLALGVVMSISLVIGFCVASVIEKLTACCGNCCGDTPIALFCVWLPLLGGVPAISWLSKHYSQVSANTYLCPFSELKLISLNTDSTDSVGHVFLMVGLASAGLMIVVFLIRLAGKDLLDVDDALRFWIRTSPLFLEDPVALQRINNTLNAKIEQYKENHKRHADWIKELSQYPHPLDPALLWTPEDEQTGFWTCEICAVKYWRQPWLPARRNSATKQWLFPVNKLLAKMFAGPLIKLRNRKSRYHICKHEDSQGLKFCHKCYKRQYTPKERKQKELMPYFRGWSGLLRKQASGLKEPLLQGHQAPNFLAGSEDDYTDNWLSKSSCLVPIGSTSSNSSSLLSGPCLVPIGSSSKSSLSNSSLSNHSRGLEPQPAAAAKVAAVADAVAEGRKRGMNLGSLARMPGLKKKLGPSSNGGQRR